MSLVGSLEDLGLGDILQIISLSRKSGVLFLRSEHGEGRIVFRDGQVQGAYVKGGPADLRGLVVGSGLLDEAAYERASVAARATGEGLEQKLLQAAGIPDERLEELRREATERAVLSMFLWPTGEFNFEIRDGGETERDAGILLRSGLPAQFLAMEGTRLRDEAGRGGPGAGQGGAAASEPDDETDDGAAFTLSGEGAAGEPAAQAPASAADALVDVTLEEMDASGETLEADLVAESASDGPPQAPAARAQPSQTAVAAPARPVDEGPGTRPPVVIVEGDLQTLEWAKEALRGVFPRVHAFQRPELGVGRVRQYLARVELPLVLVSQDTPPDPLTGARSVAELVERLKAQSPRMPIVMLVTPDRVDPRPVGGANAVAERPAASALADPRAAAERARRAAALRDTLLAAAGSGPSDRAGRRSETEPAALRRLHETSARLREAATRGEVLPLVLRFAAEHFVRVAMFMVRDDEAIGMAQLGLARAGGPDDAALRGLRLPARGPAWFRAVLDRRSAVRAAPSDSGDRQLAERLGRAVPAKAYLAPIESGDRVVALLYGDNLPADTPLGDTSALEVVIHEAGLALDRAVLERTLARAEQEAGRR